jgi:hypothetical protein
MHARKPRSLAIARALLAAVDLCVPPPPAPHVTLRPADPGRDLLSTGAFRAPADLILSLRPPGSGWGPGGSSSIAEGLKPEETHMLEGAASQEVASPLEPGSTLVRSAQGNRRVLTALDAQLDRPEVCVGIFFVGRVVTTSACCGCYLLRSPVAVACECECGM